MKKYEIIPSKHMNWDEHTLYRIKACRSFTTISGRRVTKGDLGGWIEKEDNLSQSERDFSWVFDNAKVYGNANVFDNAIISDCAQVFDNASVWDNVKVFGNAIIRDTAEIYGQARIFDNAKIYGRATVCSDAQVYGNAHVWGNTTVYGTAKVYGDAVIFGNANVDGDAEIFGCVNIFGTLNISENACIFLPEHLMCISPFPIDGISTNLTLFRTKDNKIGLHFGNLEEYEYAGSIEGFKGHIDSYLDVKDRIAAMAAVELGKRCIDLTPQKINEGESV